MKFDRIINSLKFVGNLIPFDSFSNRMLQGFK